MKALLQKIIDLVYDDLCLICNKSVKKLLVCSNCENDFIERKENHIKHLENMTVFSWALYDGKLRDGIIKLKEHKKELAPYFSKKLANFWQNLPPKITKEDFIVIPIPSHKKRIKSRGYCQSTLIAKDFAKSFNLNFSDRFVVRIKETLFMNKLENLNARIKNIKGAFKIINSFPKNKNILIIDDILTSGSTMNELAKTIKKQFPQNNLLGLTIASGDIYN